MLGGTLHDQHRLAEGQVPRLAPRLLQLPARDRPNSASAVRAEPPLPARLQRAPRPGRQAKAATSPASVRLVPSDQQRRINSSATRQLDALHLQHLRGRAHAEASSLSQTRPLTSASLARATLDLIVHGASRTMAAFPRQPGRGRPDHLRPPAKLDRTRVPAAPFPPAGLDLLMALPSGSDRTANLTRLPRAGLATQRARRHLQSYLVPRLVETLRGLHEQ